MDSVQYSTESGLLTVGGGSTWKAVIETSILHKRFLPTAECPSLGVGGLTQAGGGTIASRLHGLVVDNIEELSIVLANGTVATGISCCLAQLIPFVCSPSKQHDAQ